MGRVKLQIKKIENTTNRQVTFSKRRNGLIKKAYELSVLCDVDVALIMFSPSGRVSLFSGNKSIEEIVERYVNLPEHERGRLQNQEYIHKALEKLKSESDRTNRVVVRSPGSGDSQVEEVQQEILRCKSQLEDMEKRLRNYEGDPWEICTMAEANYREHVLNETLGQVRARKQILEEKCNNSENPQPTSSNSQVMQPLQGLQMNGNSSNSCFMIDWIPQRGVEQEDSIPSVSFLNSTAGLLPLREGGGNEEDEEEMENNILAEPSSLNLIAAASEDIHLMNNNDENSQITSCSNVENETSQPSSHHHFGGQLIDVNLSPWTHLYPTGDPFPTAQPRERALLELFLSQLAPVNQDQI